MYRFILALCTHFLIVQPAWSQQHPFIPDTESPLSTYEARSLTALWGDYDGDGDLDVLIADHQGPDELFVNGGANGFQLTEIEVSEFGNQSSAGWVDLDNDGDLDLPVTALGFSNLLANRDGGDLVYIPSPLDSYSNTREVLSADFNNDGALDLFLIRRSSRQNVLLRNEGVLGLVPDFEGGYAEDFHSSNSGCIGDYDNDGDPDLYVANSDLQTNDFYRNEEGLLNRVEEQSITRGAYSSTSCAWGDYDNDGDLDFFVTEANEIPNRLFRNDDGVFKQMGEDVISTPRNDAVSTDCAIGRGS